MIFITILVFITVSIIAIFAISNEKTETQKYEVLYEKDNLEIRYYPQAILATVEMDGNFDDSRNDGFRVLAGYIFGSNKENSKIAMTSPVRVSGEDHSKKMSFVLPSKMEFDKLPEPNNDAVILHQSKPMITASVSFGGYANEKTISKHKEKLTQGLKQLNLQHNSQFEYLGYNPPYEFVNRRNEVHVELDEFNAEMLVE